MNRFDGGIFLENIEWFDQTGKELLHRLPPEGSGEIKYGAQLTVRESQAAVLFYKGKVCHIFGAGRYTLKTANLPLLTKILSIPWRGDSPLRAEVYFLNLKQFTNLKWGTVNPVAFRDSELGLIRLRAHGVFNIQIMQPALFINSMAGTVNSMHQEDVEEYLKRVIVARLNDFMGENLDTILDLAGKYDELSLMLQKRLTDDFAQFGLKLTSLYITSITPPEEVQQAIDDKGRLNVIHDMDKFVRMKAAAAMEKAAMNPGDAGSGMGLGLGMMMPALFSSRLTGQNETQSKKTSTCAECGNSIPSDSRFCPMCGHQQVIFGKCSGCGKNLPPHAKFCPRCGLETGTSAHSAICPHCKAECIGGSSFCSECGNRL